MRHVKRIKTFGEEATAQEPGGSAHESGYKLKCNTELSFLSCNIRGLNKLAKRQQLSEYLLDKNIDIVLLQETKVKHKGMENTPGATLFFFSSQATTKSHIKQ